MAPGALRILTGAEPLAHGEVEGLDHADGHRLAMQQAAVIAALRLQRVAEGVAEVQQGALVVLALVRRHDLGLGTATAGHRLLPRRRIARDDSGTVDLQPLEEVPVTQQAVLHHLRIAGQHLALGQAVQRAGIGQHQRGLVEGADQVLALRRVDRGLAAHGTVHLGQQAGRNLDEVGAPAQDRRRETGQVADHAATQRDDHVIPPHPLRDQPAGHALQFGEALRGLPRRQGQDGGGDSLGLAGIGQHRQLGPGHVLVGDDGDAGPLQHRRDVTPGGRQQAGADQDVVGPRAQRDMYGCGHCRAALLPCCDWRSRASMIRSTTTSWVSPPLSTTRSDVS